MQTHELLRELKRSVDELRAFNEIGRTLTSTLEIGEVLRIIMQKVSELLGPSNWSLLLLDERTSDLYFEVSIGEGSEKFKGVRIALGEGLAGWVAREGQAVLVDHARSDPRFSSRCEEMDERTTRCVLAVPLRSKGRVFGVIELLNDEGARAFTPEDLQTLGTIADYAAIAIENAKNFERIRELTLVDEHTGLFNARHLYRTLESEVARARRFGRTFSVVFFDLDLFKKVNDQHGHQCGSAVLREVGEVLRRVLRTMDVPIRYGGDEFVVILPEADRAHAAAAAERLRRAVAETVFLKDRGLEVRITASFGVATFPTDASGVEEILRTADAAMYRVKETGRNAVADAAALLQPK
jgi:diguanylate cyclase (GGDEF)-like protein